MSVCPRCGHDETDHGIVTGCTVCRCSGLVPVEGDADFDATAPDYRRTPMSDERTPTAEPVTAAGRALHKSDHGGYECPVALGHVSCESLTRILAIEAEAAQRSTAEVERLREALKEAREDVASWGAYASDYFQEKWNLAGDLARIDAALAEPDHDDRPVK
jgi:hypothetical protein